MRFTVLALLAASAACQSVPSPQPAQAAQPAHSAESDGEDTSADGSGKIYFEFEVMKPVSQRPGTASLRYPSELRKANIEGQVLVQFVVDTKGVVDMSTFKVLGATEPLFVLAVKDCLSGTHYYPAEIGGKKVRQLVQQRFDFKLAR